MVVVVVVWEALHDTKGTATRSTSVAVVAGAVDEMLVVVVVLLAKEQRVETILSTPSTEGPIDVKTSHRDLKRLPLKPHCVTLAVAPKVSVMVAGAVRDGV